MSRILVWSPNYAPEWTGIPPLVTDAAEWLGGCGHTVDVVTAVPNYPERIIRPEYRRVLYRSGFENGVGIHRSWLRVRPRETFLDKALYEASFVALSFPRVLARLCDADAVVCVVPSLLAATLEASVVRRPRLALWVQDLVAEAARAVADAPGGSADQRQRHAERPLVCIPEIRARSISSVQQVSVLTLDALLEHHGRPDVVKIDIEGAEGTALAAADIRDRSP